MNNLARALQQADRVPESITLYEQALARLRAKLGIDHPTTLAAMSGLADSYRLVGSLDRAISLLAATWEGRMLKLGPDHPDTLLTILRLAEAYQASGQSTKAVAAGARILAEDGRNSATGCRQRSEWPFRGRRS